VYKTTEWEDRVVDQQTGDVLVEGTPVNEVNLNNIETGVHSANSAIAILIQYFMQFDRWVRQKVADYAAEFLNEVQTVTLTNTKRFPFNDSIMTVSLTTVRKTLNYDVDWEITSANGNVGDIIVSDKQLNGFKIAFDGSATSVTLKLRIKGGMLV